MVETDAAVPESFPAYRVVGACVRGASHVRARSPNQDALHWLPRAGYGPPLVVAVADGHGSGKCFRSHRGAWFAVREASASLLNFAKVSGSPQIPGHEMGDCLSAFDAQDLSRVKHVANEWLPREVSRRWQEAVDDDLRRRPFSNRELLGAQAQDSEAPTRVFQQPRLAYGTTLLAALLTRSYVLYLQLGDGNILEVSDLGETFQPVPVDERLFADETTSLCGATPWFDFRVSFQTLAGRYPALIMLSTDGYANSFGSPEGFLQVGADLVRRIGSNGLEAVGSQLAGWLSTTSGLGSGDDIAVGMLCRISRDRATKSEQGENSNQ